MSDINEKIVDKIRKLFALSQSPNEAEAASAMQKAHELLKAYNLSMADVSAEEKPETASQTFKTNNKNRNEAWKTRLLHVVARGNYCAMITIRGRDGALWHEVFGREENIAATLAMYEYLEETVRRISIAAKDVVENYSYKEFRIAMVERLGERLEELKVQEAAEGCTALVVVSDEARKALYAAHSNARASHSNVNRSSDSAEMGRRAAESVSLNRQID